MLNNPIGVAAYMLLRNDWAWKLLTEQERKLILEQDMSWNTGRDDYANPKEYGVVRQEGGDNWDPILIA